MCRRPPRSTRTDTLCPYPTRCRSAAVLSAFAIFGGTKWVLGDRGAVIGGEGFLDAPSDALTGSVAAAATATTGFTGMDLFWCMMIGLVVTGLIVWITEYYTGPTYARKSVG